MRAQKEARSKQI